MIDDDGRIVHEKQNRNRTGTKQSKHKLNTNEMPKKSIIKQISIVLN